MRQTMNKRLPGLFMVTALFALLFTAQLPAAEKNAINTELAAMRAEIETNGYTFTVGITPAFNYYQPGRLLSPAYNPTSPLLPLSEAIINLPTLEEELPPAYTGYFTPVKDQGSCGSGWAFSALGTFESIILKKDGVEVDLSEQQLVSCNPWGWGCNGGLWPNDMVADPGVMLESCFPYAEDEVPCDETCPIAYQAAGWAFLEADYAVPPVETIKQAIYTYGAVQAAVYADKFFSAYTGGVFNKCKKNVGYTNHVMVLCGWDDSIGAWLLKNSWSTDWGENGFMWITYGCNRVGEGANVFFY